MSTRERLTETFEELQRQRDELRVKMHLAKLDAQDEWAAVEKRWHEVEPKLAKFGSEAADSTADVGAALKIVAEEIAHGYRRLRDAVGNK